MVQHVTKYVSMDFAAQRQVLKYTEFFMKDWMIFFPIKALKDLFFVSNQVTFSYPIVN